MNHNTKIGIITSNGGHLFQAIQLKEILQKHHHFWVVEEGIDSDSYLKNESTYLLKHRSVRSIINFIYYSIKAFIIFYRERPQVLFSCGAGIVVPFFLVGKYFFKTKLVFIEPYDFIAYPSLTGKIIVQFTDLFLIQHEVQKKWYPNATYWGSLL